MRPYRPTSSSRIDIKIRARTDAAEHRHAQRGANDDVLQFFTNSEATLWSGKSRFKVRIRRISSDFIERDFGDLLAYFRSNFATNSLGVLETGIRNSLCNSRLHKRIVRGIRDNLAPQSLEWCRNKFRAKQLKCATNGTYAKGRDAGNVWIHSRLNVLHVIVAGHRPR